MKPKRSAKSKPVAVPRDQPLRMLDMEVDLAGRVSSVEQIFRGMTTTEMRRERVRSAIGSRMAEFAERFERVYGAAEADARPK